ncbi:hypothetical protein [Pinirhizobacter sp.]|uniref:hypothetical protein n=1 Tax=Pinirhizobacter sp. TaxID=2950432 RepID=UPI002F405AC9
MAEDANNAWRRVPWKRVSWELQNYIFFYLRSHHYSITPSNTDAVAQVIADRLAAGPMKHCDLDVIIDRSAVDYQLDANECDISD